MILQLDSENSDYDLTAQQTVLTHTPSVTNNILCEVVILIGDGVKDLDGDAKNLEVTITVGGVTWPPDPDYIILADETRCYYSSGAFSVPANKEVVVKLLSPDADDDDVDVTAYLYEVNPASVDANGRLDISKISGTTQTATDVGNKVNGIYSYVETTIPGDIAAVQATADSNYAILASLMIDGSGRVDLGSINGDSGAADSLARAVAWWGNKHSYDLEADELTVRNSDDSADLMTVTWTEADNVITRTVTEL